MKRRSFLACAVAALLGALRICPKCGAVMPSSGPCVACGYVEGGRKLGGEPGRAPSAHSTSGYHREEFAHDRREDEDRHHGGD